MFLRNVGNLSLDRRSEPSTLLYLSVVSSVPSDRGRWRHLIDGQVSGVVQRFPS